MYKEIITNLPVGNLLFKIRSSYKFINMLKKIYRETSESSIIIGVIEIEETSEKFILKYNSIIYKPSKKYILTSLHVLVSEIISSICSKRKILNFHGTAIFYKGKTILLLGEKGQGKTTFLSKFISHGATFISDESVVYTGEEIIPYQSCLHMNKYTIKCLNKNVKKITIKKDFLFNDKLYIYSTEISEIIRKKNLSPNILVLLNDNNVFEKCKYDVNLVKEVMKYCRNACDINMKLIIKLFRGIEIFKCNKYSFEELISII